MYGYLTASAGRLTAEETERYRSAYCGMCRALRERHGEIAGLTLNFDMTFLVLLLDSLYEPDRTSGKNRCLPHPDSGRSWDRSIFTDYAADMNMGLHI